MSTHPDYGLSKEQFISKIRGDKGFAKKNFVEKWGELGPIYGKQWKEWGSRYETNNILDTTKRSKPGIDQIANLINELKTNPDSRRLVVSAWNVGELDQMVLPPCHYGFQIYTRRTTREEKIVNPGKYRAISLMWNQRSVDTFLGLPFNIASYALLLEIIAESVNMIPDELIGNLGDVHLYNNHLEQASEQCNRTPYDLPKLNINTEFWPTENGSCGEGSLDATAVFNSFQNDNFCKCLLEEDIQLYDYQSHPAIKGQLSN
jgi:thymidylate synthase